MSGVTGEYRVNEAVVHDVFAVQWPDTSTGQDETVQHLRDQGVEFNLWDCAVEQKRAGQFAFRDGRNWRYRAVHIPGANFGYGQSAEIGQWIVLWHCSPLVLTDKQFTELFEEVSA